MRSSWGDPPGPLAAVDTSGFELRLAPGHPLAEACERIRGRTPRETVLLVDDPRLDLSALCSRPLYAPERHAGILPGVGIDIPFLMRQVRGYPPALLDARMRDRDELFDGPDRAGALSRVRELGRPVAILADTARHAPLADWLFREAPGTELYAGPGVLVWLAPEGGRTVPDTAGPLER